ncbi:MAG: DUF1467 family protein [Methylovirgula sp.]
MPLSVPLAIALFLTIWFVVLFAVLPFGVRSQNESGDFLTGTDPGAPVAPRILNKILWTTAIAIVVFGLVIFAVSYLG